MKKCINILQYGALTTNKGGIESYIISQLRHINRNFFKYDFLIAKNSPKVAYEDEIKSYKCNIYRDYIPWSKSFFGHYYALYKFFKKNKGKYDIVVTNIVDFHNINILIVAKLFGVKTCIAHSHMANDLRSNLLKNIFIYINKKIGKYFCDYLFACSEQAGEWLFGNLWNEKKTLVLKNAIEVENFSFNFAIRNKIRKILHVEDNIVIGHTGKFTDQKNHEFLIKIFKEIYDRNNNFRLILVGEGNLKNSIKAKVKKMGLEDAVIFLGMRADVNNILQGMDIFLFPSKYEGLSVSLIEAQASGLKCFVSDTVSSDVKITDLVDFISLEEKPAFWASKILSSYQYIRKNVFFDIKNSGYDIITEINKIEDFYKNVADNKI